MHWKEEYEDAAGADFSKFAALSIAELLERVRQRQFGNYYSIWDAIAAKRDLSAVGWPLFEFLHSSADYLNRYHCARVLLLLLDNTTFQPVDLTVQHRNPEKALAEIEVILASRIGVRANSA